MARTELNQIFYRWAQANKLAPVPGFGPVATSFYGSATLRLWHGRLEHWLRTAPDGHPPDSQFYASFGEDAALIFRRQPGGPQSATAHLLIGPATVLAPALALELRDNDWAPPEGAGAPARLAPVPVEGLPTASSDLRAPARSDAARLLIPALSQILSGRPSVLLPGSAPVPLPRTVLWGVQAILGVLAEGASDASRWAFSFATYEDRADAPPGPGCHVAFHREAPEPNLDRAFGNAAITIVSEYVDRGVDGVRVLLAMARVLEPADLDARLGRILTQWPGVRQPAAPASGGSMPATTPASRGMITCPICLSRVNWEELDPYRFDGDLGRYVELTIPDDASPELRNRLMRTAAVRCPNIGEQTSIHFLPAAYGVSEPVVLGFVGASRSGKTHLLSAMVGAIEQGGLSACGVSVRPVDLSRHQSLLEDSVRPLLGRSKVLSPTREGVVSFVDAFLITEPGRRPRPVALFDVAGGELTDVEDAKRFLDVADGLIFVVDPDQFDGDGLGDLTFNTVLGLLEASGRLPKVSAAIVLNKADLLRFDDPVAHWLRRDRTGLDAGELLRESADVYGYLHRRGAQAWTRPYRECSRATLHFASAIGSSLPHPEGEAVQDVYPRGVSPRRVLGPLIALLAMTGVLTSEEAAKVGI